MTATLTYNYGETPEDVIRERHREYLVANPSAPRYSVGALLQTSTDHLITVLDALKRDSWMIVEGRAGRSAQNTDPGKLRIEILAALGVTES